MSGLLDELDRQARRDQWAVPHEATVVAASGSGVTFELTDVDGFDGVTLGPATAPTWTTTTTTGDHSHDASLDPLQPGDRILVMFAGGDLDRPWVVAAT